MTSPKDAMPWVGLYIFGASLVCTLATLQETLRLYRRHGSIPATWIINTGDPVAGKGVISCSAMAADLIRGFRQRNLWFPCKFFTINAASITLITIAMKLTVDLTTQMPHVYYKSFSFHFLFTMLANFLPSLGLMDDQELLLNIIAMGILVITILVNLLIQICTGAIPISFDIMDIIYLVSPALLPFSVALIVPTSRRIIDYKFTYLHDLDSTCRRVTFSSKELKHNVKKYWMMTTTGNPQFVIACSSICYALGVMCIGIAIRSVFILVDTFKYPSRAVLWYGESDYKWSTHIILIMQSFGVQVGCIAPVFRCFSSVRYFNISKRWTVNHLNVFKVEKYWTQKLQQWRHNHVDSHIRGHYSKIVLHSLKNMVLSICIALQTTVVIICKTVCLVPKLFIILFVYGCYLCMPLLERFMEEPHASNTNARSEIEEYTSYVLQVEDETNLSKMLLENMLGSITRLLHESEQKEPVDLLKLLEKSKEFNGVLEIENDQVPPLHPKENQNAWSLVAVTLTAIALALPNIADHQAKELLAGLREGLRFVRHVEENLNANIEDLVEARKASWHVWRALESCGKWLRIDLQNDARKGKTSREILQWLGDEAVKVVIQFKRENIGSLDHSIHRIRAANSMYRISQSILLYCNSQENWPNDEEMFELVTSIIADVLSACFTNLPRVITMKCHHKVIEKREDNIMIAAQLLGKSKKILKILKTRQLPNIDLDAMAYIDKWRVSLKDQISNTSASSVPIQLGSSCHNDSIIVNIV